VNGCACSAAYIDRCVYALFAKCRCVQLSREMMADQHFEEIVERSLPAKLFRRSVGIAFDFGMVTV